MENREIAIKDVAEAVYVAFTEKSEEVYTDFQLKHFELTPIESVTADLMPCVLLLEGEDTVKNRSSRGYLGYPLRRSFDLLGEVWVHDATDPREKVLAMYRAFRRAALPTSGTLPGGSAIREMQALGPFSETHEGSLGMRIILEILYVDNNL